ncbi:MAG: DUF1643 domain-containing protein [Pseudomonadota bacterium]
MITRSHIKGDAASTAVYSDCMCLRYSLTRVWKNEGRRLLFVMLNPSTATEIQNDPTVERCERRARHLGFGAFCVTNIIAFRATDPKDLRRAPQPIGPHNDQAIADATLWADEIIAAWGVHGAHMNRGPEVAKTLRAATREVYHLGLSKDGHPRHPLYLPYAQQPVLWE